jgi:probable phosphoglycerate mutase
MADEASGGCTPRLALGAHRLVLVRHGETAWSRALRHTGRTDVPLNSAGREQARALRATLAGYQFSRILTSPLERARDTCRLAGFGERAECLDDLREWDYGAYEGLTTSEIRKRQPGWFLWRDGVPDGESLESLEERAERVIVAVEMSSGDILAFAHAHLLRVLAARWLGLPGAEGARFALRPGSVSVLGWEREVRALLSWNNGVPLQ